MGQCFCKKWGLRGSEGEGSAEGFPPSDTSLVGQPLCITIRQPFLTIPKYGHFGQKMDFPIDFIFRKCNFLERARDDKNFELSYAQKSQVLVDLATKLSKKCYFGPKIWSKMTKFWSKLFLDPTVFLHIWKEQATTVRISLNTSF